MSNIEMTRVFKEYLDESVILKYTRASAGFGISYLLDHDYKSIYLEALSILPPEMKRDGLSVLELGCGGGMNLIHLVSVLNQKAIPIRRAVGTDFSPVLIDAANREAKSYLHENQRQQVEFYLAKHETLIEDLHKASRMETSQLRNSFNFVLGVNTVRYSHHAGTEQECAQTIADVLMPGGVCVMIDMNDKFPFFKSEVKNRFRTQKREECYIPSLAEYTTPFRQVGLEVLRSENFCWIPHSSGQLMCHLLSALSPVLNVVARSRAMRSLVVARKR